MVLSSGVSIDFRPFLSLYGPWYSVLAPEASHLVSRQIAYVGPPLIWSVAKTRWTPYLMSRDVIGDPSSNLRPSLSLYVQTVLFSWPSGTSVARSAVTSVPAAPGSAL